MPFFSFFFYLAFYVYNICLYSCIQYAAHTMTLSSFLFVRAESANWVSCLAWNKRFDYNITSLNYCFYFFYIYYVCVCMGGYGWVVVCAISLSSCTTLISSKHHKITTIGGIYPVFLCKYPGCFWNI